MSDVIKVHMNTKSGVPSNVSSFTHGAGGPRIYYFSNGSDVKCLQCLTTGRARDCLSDIREANARGEGLDHCDGHGIVDPSSVLRSCELFVDAPNCSISIGSKDSLDALKERLQDEIGIPPDQACIFLGSGLTLTDNGKTLADLGIGDESTLYVALAFRGC